MCLVEMEDIEKLFYRDIYKEVGTIESSIRKCKYKVDIEISNLNGITDFKCHRIKSNYIRCVLERYVLMYS